VRQSVRETAAIARNSDGDLALFISPLAGAPQLDHFSYSPADREIVLYSRGIASEVLDQGYDRDLLVVQQFDDGGLAALEQQVSPLIASDPRS
jgi:hypothetical protein